jgi:hypothetical protein
LEGSVERVNRPVKPQNQKNEELFMGALHKKMNTKISPGKSQVPRPVTHSDDEDIRKLKEESAETKGKEYLKYLNDVPENRVKIMLGHKQNVNGQRLWTINPEPGGNPMKKIVPSTLCWRPKNSSGRH